MASQKTLLLLASICAFCFLAYCNEFPTCPESYYIVSVKENTTGVLIDLNCTDPEGGNLTYALDGKFGNEFEFVVPNSGNLSFTGIPNAEKPLRISDVENYQYPHSVRVSVREENGWALIVTVFVSLISVNEFPPEIINLTSSVDLPEDTPVGTQVAKCELKDNDRAGGLDSTVLVEIEAGNNDTRFSIDFYSCDIRLIGPLDYETKTSYTLTIRAFDLDLDNPLQTFQNITIYVTDVNDNEPTCNAYNIIKDVRESTLPGSVLETVVCSDVDTGLGQELEYNIISGNVTELDVNITTGEIILRKNLDFEAGDTLLQGIVLVKDKGSPIRTATVSVGFRITDVDDNAPVFSNSSYSTTVSETAAIGSAVLNLTATDADAPNTELSKITYGFESCTQDWFEVDSRTGSVLIKENLDWENASTVYCQVFAYSSDQINNKNFANISINIDDVNDRAPEFSEFLFEAKVPENTTLGTSILTIMASDSDRGANGEFTFEALGTTFFDIDPVSGVVNLTQVLDYETKTIHLFRVKATDKGKPTLTSLTYVSIEVSPVNEFAPAFAISPLPGADISESSLPGATVATVSAIDKDKGDDGEVEYYLETSNVPFLIERESGAVVVLSGLDYETDKTYQLTIKAVDKSTNPKSTTETLTVTVSDENDNAPTCTPLKPIKVTLATDITNPIGSLICTDPDSSGSSLTYREVSGDPDDLFLLDMQDGRLRLRNRQIPGTYLLLVSVSDSNFQTLVPIQIEVESTISFVNMASSPFVTVSEDKQISERIFKVEASGSYDLITYTIISGNDDGTFSLHPTLGDLRLVRELDRETKDEYKLEIEAETTHGQKDTITLEIDVVDVNDNSPKLKNPYYTFNITEGISVPRDLIQITATDRDIGVNAELTYYIESGDPDNTFSYNSSGHLQVVKSLDHDTTPSYTLVLGVRDKGTRPLSSTTIVFIQVLNEDEHAPEIVGVGSGGTVSLALSEDTAIGAKVFRIDAIDMDAGSELTYKFGGGNGEEMFSIDPTTGEIYLVFPLDRETEDTFSMIVVVNNTKGETKSATVIISVTDANDNNPEFDRGNYVFDLPHNTPADTDIRTLGVSDDDIGNNGVFTLSIESGDPNGRFKFNGNTLVSAKVLDYNDEAKYDLVVTATDQGTVTRSSSVNVTVLIDPPFKQPKFEPDSDTIQLNETRTVGSLVYDTDAVKAGAVEKANGDLKYRIISGNDDNKFFVEEFSGVIQLLQPLNYATKSSYTLEIQAVNRYRTTLEDRFTLSIQVQQVNRHDPVFSKEVYVMKVSENTGVGVSVGQIEATDDDPGQFGELTYNIESNDYFSVDQTSGSITVRKTLEYSLARSHNLYVTATDKAGATSRTASAVVILNIEDFNNHAPAFSNSSYTVTVPETLNTGEGFYILIAKDLDSDTYGPVEYKIMSGNTNNIFSIDISTGVLSLTSQLDFEAMTQHVLTVEASDGGSPSLTGTTTLTIQVRDENDNSPQFPSSTVSISITSDIPVLDSIYTAVAIDADAGSNGEVNYFIESGNTGGYFSVGSMTGEIKTTRSLSSAKDFYDLVIVAVDEGLPAKSSTVTLSIAIKPIVTATSGDQNLNIEEGRPVGSVVGMISNPTGQTVTGYTITGGNFDSSFAITTLSNGDGQLTTKRVLDRENYAFFQLSVSAQYNGGTKEFTVAVAVDDVNEPAQFEPPLLTIQIPENVPTGSVIGTVTVTDSDSTGVNSNVDLAISPVGPLGTYFSVSQSGEISVAQPISYEVFTDLLFYVTATDKGNPPQTATGTVSVVITDVPENITTKQIETTSFVSHEFPHDAVAGDVVYTVVPGDFGLTLGSSDTYKFISLGDSVFNVDPSTGVMTVNKPEMIFDEARYFQWMILMVKSGSTTTSHSGLVRLDTFNRADHLIALKTSIDQTTLDSRRANFSDHLQSFYGSPRSVRIWATQAGTAVTGRRRLLAVESTALAIVLADSSADDISNIDKQKTFLSADTAAAVLQASSDGTPKSGVSVTGAQAVPVTEVSPYIDDDDDDDDLSTAMIILIVLASIAALLLIIALIALLIYCLYYRRGKNNDKKRLVEDDKDSFGRLTSGPSSANSGSHGANRHEPIGYTPPRESMVRAGGPVIAAVPGTSSDNPKVNSNGHTRSPSPWGKRNAVEPIEDKVPEKPRVLPDDNIRTDPDLEDEERAPTRAMYISSTYTNPKIEEQLVDLEDTSRDADKIYAPDSSSMA